MPGVAFSSISLLFLVLICVISQIECHGFMTIHFKTYINSGGSGANGHCCDGKWGLCQKNGCDHMFTFCINDYIIDDDSMASTADCNLFLENTSEIENQNRITFGSNIAGVNNPIMLEFLSSPTSLQIKVMVYDKDSLFDEINDNEFVDFLRADLTQDMIDTTYMEGGQDFILDSRTELTVNIHSVCGPNFFGDRCTRQCLPPSAGEYYHCDQDTGKKVCEDGWYGDVCDQEYCALKDCQNGATCSHAHDQAFCVCPDGYSGDSCEYADIPFCAEFCVFGECEIINNWYGEDLEPNSYRCHCFEGFEITVEFWGETCTLIETTTTMAPTTTNLPTTTTEAPVFYVDRSNADCDTLASHGYRYQDGIYTLQPAQATPFRAYCDMSAEGWTVIQRRRTGELSFDKTWEEYKNGFGELGPTSEFWLGLDKIYHLTNQRRYKLLITLRVADGTFRFVEYSHFYIESESNGYTLHVIDGTSGNAGDAFANSNEQRNNANGQRFSTPDRDNDNMTNFDCAGETSSGWWFSGCTGSNLNGIYIISTNGWAECISGQCLSWNTIPGFEDYSLTSSVMKIIPDKDYVPYYPEGHVDPFK